MKISDIGKVSSNNLQKDLIDPIWFSGSQDMDLIVK
jgi:hypothetical protein